MAYTVHISWEKKPTEAFTDNHYSRAHTWTFDGGVTLPASSSPHVVPLPYSDESAGDPEEAYIASISSCHMLWFLSVAVEKRCVVERYEDNAEGVLGKNEEGRLAMTKVTLKPKVTFKGSTLTRGQVTEMHQMAHEKCFIASSVKTTITILPDFDGEEG